jgi:hypothetical protein
MFRQTVWLGLLHRVVRAPPALEGGEPPPVHWQTGGGDL